MEREQLTLFVEYTTQNHFSSEVWGMLVFVETGSSKWKDNCRHCPLYKREAEQTQDDECLSAPCSHDVRRDGKDGYFAIHQMPKID